MGQSVNLYGWSGHHIQMSRTEWNECLACAASQGWVAAGTSRPPIHFYLHDAPVADPWNGSYSEPLGQRVTSADAANLSEAWSKAAKASAQRRQASNLSRLVRLAQAGSFLISGETSTIGTWAPTPLSNSGHSIFQREGRALSRAS